MFSSPRELIVAVVMAACFLVCGSGVALASTNVSLAAAVNVDGIANTGSAVPAGGLDQFGDAYSAALLGTTATWSGVTFALGGADALDATSGSTLSLPAGSYSKLYMLATGVNGDQPNQTFVVTYTDGTTSTFTQSLSDWFAPQNYAGESKALTEAYRLNSRGAIETGPFYVYGYSFALNTAKTVKSVALPRNRGVVVLALSLAPSGTTTTTTTTTGATSATTVSLAAAVNVDGIGNTGSAVPAGGLDQFGDVYPAASLGTTATWSGMTFALGGADALDATSGSTLSLPAGSYSKLYMLATGVNGDQPNQTFVVTYTDGTTSTFTQSLSDWFAPQNYAGESKALTEAYRLNVRGAIETGPFYVYGYSFALNTAKTVKSVALPRNRGVVVLALSLAPSGTTTTTATGATPSVAIPAIPANLAARPGNAQVGVAWTASSGATSYHVKRATTSGGPYTQVGAPTTTSYTDASLTDGTTYFYVVSALDSAGESANSAQVNATPIAPAAVITTPPPSTSTSSSTSTASSTSTSSGTSTSTSSSNPVAGAAAGACGMQLGGAITFCETFDAPAGVAGTRTGDLDPNVWGVSRAIGQGVNFGQLEYGMWNPTTIDECNGSTPTVSAPANIIICNGQLREASNDNNAGCFECGDVTVQAMYPKQPFDFAGRTGTVSFDVSNDAGPHGAWPEFWISDLPVPIPFNHFDSWESLPANGFGIRFDSVAPIGMQGTCPNTNNLNQLRWTVESAAVVRSYVLEDTLGFGVSTGVTVTDLDCVILSSGPGNMNHVEVRISQNQIDVYATDAGVAATPATLKHIAVVTNANLTFTRGFVWLEDVHYNGDKILDTTRPSMREHTFSWDNVAFDGPFTDRDFAFDAPDNTLPAPNGAFSLGEFSLGGQTSTWNVPNIPANNSLAAAARVLFSFNGGGTNPTQLTVTVNNHTHTVPWPYPENNNYDWRTYALQIPLTDLVAGTNAVQLGGDVPLVFTNVDIVLGDVAGGVPVLPGSNRAYP